MEKNVYTNTTLDNEGELTSNVMNDGMVNTTSDRHRDGIGVPKDEKQAFNNVYTIRLVTRVCV